MTYKYRNNQRSMESRHRNPKKIKGLRCKLRTALRAAGVKGKFQTDYVRYLKCLVVEANPPIELPFDTFEGYQVRSLRN